MKRLSGIVHSLVRRLNCATVGVLVVDDDCSPRVEVLLHLEDVHDERDFLGAIGGSLAGHNRFDDLTQGVRTEQGVGNEWYSKCGDTLRAQTSSASCTTAMLP
jgi:hypothetical protein